MHVLSALRVFIPEYRPQHIDNHHFSSRAYVIDDVRYMAEVLLLYNSKTYAYAITDVATQRR
jgi:hypothetical protein